jgi:hypothetical protein
MRSISSAPCNRSVSPNRLVLLLAALAAQGLGNGPARDTSRHPSPPEPLRGSLHLRIDDPANSRRRNLRLDQPGALPLKAHDRFRIEATLNRPAYLYLIWIGADGKAAPIYPWAPGHWDRRPANEVRIDRLDLPPKADYAWEIPGGSPGLETIILLARAENPLPRDVDLAKLLAGLPAQPRIALGTAVWIENGREITHDLPGRAAPGSKTRKSDDPVLRMRRLLQDKVQPWGDYSQAVIFPNQGGR